MKTSSAQAFVLDAQNAACTIQSLSDILHERVDHLWSYADMPYDGCKEEMFALIDSINRLAKHINVEGVMI